MIRLFENFRPQKIKIVCPGCCAEDLKKTSSEKIRIMQKNLQKNSENVKNIIGKKSVTAFPSPA
jgi:hypothetical protein